ncbi:MAG: nucleotidyltransferase family protein [bacterium]|nr:nucleotidyltransferase family protein [bacterium]
MMRVFILAAGLGTRIRAQYPDIPKCLIPVRGKPFLLWQMRYLMDQGFKDFVLCVGYRKEQVMEYFKDGSEFGASVEYSTEDEPQGTGSTLGTARKFFSDTSLVLNGDTYLPVDYRKLVESHRHSAAQGGALVTMALFPTPDFRSSGRVVLGADGRISEFIEKKKEWEKGDLANAGAYVLESSVMELIPQTGPCSLEHDVFPSLAERGLLRGVRVERGFIDMGSPQGLAELEAFLSHE